MDVFLFVGQYFCLRISFSFYSLSTYTNVLTFQGTIQFISYVTYILLTTPMKSPDKQLLKLTVYSKNGKLHPKSCTSFPQD